tara:strand:+ start:352 stop:486 length:135 start_codon:yes stop_codon:yes gene_type:complete
MQNKNLMSKNVLKLSINIRGKIKNNDKRKVIDRVANNAQIAKNK